MRVPQLADRAEIARNKKLDRVSHVPVPLVHGRGPPRSNDLFVVDQFVVNADRAAVYLLIVVFLARESEIEPELRDR